MITAKVEGLKEFNRSIKPFVTGEFMQKPVERAGQMFRNALAEYPPYARTPDLSGGSVQSLKQRPDSRYKRTGRLGAGWRYKTFKTKESYTVELYNSVYYASKVVGTGTQLPIHQKYWRTTTQSMLLALGAVSKEMQRQVDLTAAKV